MGSTFTQMRNLVTSEDLHTVCQAAGCPNIFECWEDREATFLIGGDMCTRRCDFCQIDTGKPASYDTDEPARIAASVKKLNLLHAVVTGVCRDDLPDGGAWLYAQTVRCIHEDNLGVSVEMLVPDFSGAPSLLEQIIDANPEVFGHNIETVPRLFRSIRPGFDFEVSLQVLATAHAAGLITKSNLMLGMGESDAEVYAALEELHAVGTDLITITQYLRPSLLHHPVDRWVTPEQFDALAVAAKQIGFAGVMAGPLVRSSYRAGRMYREAIAAREVEIGRNA